MESAPESDVDHDYEIVPTRKPLQLPVTKGETPSVKPYQSPNNNGPDSSDGLASNIGTHESTEATSGNTQKGNANGNENGNPTFTLSHYVNAENLSPRELNLYLSIKGHPEPSYGQANVELDTYDDVKRCPNQDERADGKVNKEGDGPRFRGYTDGHVRYVDGTKIFRQVQNEPYNGMVSQCSETSQSETKKERKAPKVLITIVCFCLLISLGVVIALVLHLVGVLNTTNDMTDEIANLRKRVTNLERLTNSSRK